MLNKLQFWDVISKQHRKVYLVNPSLCYSLISKLNFHPRDEAEMEYLKIAQDLEMYGVSYFAIKVQ